MGRSRPSPVSKQRERAQRRAAKHKVCVCGGGGLFAIFAGRGIKITVLFWEMSPSAGIRPKTRSCSPLQVTLGDGGAARGGRWAAGAALGWGERPMLSPCLGSLLGTKGWWVGPDTNLLCGGGRGGAELRAQPHRLHAELSPNCTSKLIPPSPKHAEQRAMGQPAPCSTQPNPRPQLEPH